MKFGYLLLLGFSPRSAKLGVVLQKENVHNMKAVEGAGGEQDRSRLSSHRKIARVQEIFSLQIDGFTADSPYSRSFCCKASSIKNLPHVPHCWPMSECTTLKSLFSSCISEKEAECKVDRAQLDKICLPVQNTGLKM